MGFLGNILSNAVNQTVNRTVSNVVSDATSKAANAISDKVIDTTKTAVNNSKSKMREKILEGAKTYRDNPIGKLEKDSNVVLFASDKEVKYQLNNLSYKVDVVGCVTWTGKEFNYAESNPLYYSNLAYEYIQKALNHLADNSVEPAKLANNLPIILSDVNSSELNDTIKNQYGHTVLVSIMLLELPDIDNAESYSGPVNSVNSTHICPYCGTSYEGSICPYCGANLEE